MPADFLALLLAYSELPPHIIDEVESETDPQWLQHADRVQEIIDNTIAEYRDRQNTKK